MVSEQGRKPLLLIVSGPSGAGKGTLIAKMRKQDPSIHFSCSITTRSMRAGEVEGVDYRFVTREQYDEYARQDAFLEKADVHEHSYGTLKSEVLGPLTEGRDVVVDVNPEGAISLMDKLDDYVSVFILPPSFGSLRERLLGRKSETEKSIEIRLRNAREEMKTVHRYQYVIINDQVDSAFARLQGIVNAEKQRTTRFFPIIPEV